jgi:hypothetical protein
MRNHNRIVNKQFKYLVFDGLISYFNSGIKEEQYEAESIYYRHQLRSGI